MGLAVAVRAEQDALRELGFDLLPRAENSIRRYGEVLRARVEVVELEQASMNPMTAAHTHPTERHHRFSLALATERDERRLTLHRSGEMAYAMTVGA
ncbi:MAG TPA: hypothetical protein VL493_06550, partial [Candidatus Saccharimonadales bacterium]|nr:hypothetical protein [Candidatus Saccharimonadales bacterium]